MKEDKRIRIEEKRSRHQELIKLRSYCTQHLEPWLEIYDQLLVNQAQPTILYLAATLESNPEIFLQAVGERLKAHHTHLLERVITHHKLPVHHQLQEEYPSVNPLRYVPAHSKLIVEEDSLVALHQAIDVLQLKNQHCLVFYPKYTPVMELTLNEVLSTSSILYEPMEDICVAAKDLKWLIFRSLESEWAWVKAY